MFIGKQFSDLDIGGFWFLQRYSISYSQKLVVYLPPKRETLCRLS